MKASLLAFTFLCACTSGPSTAQGCPAGIPSAGNPACIPPDRTNSPYYQQSGQGRAASVGRWESRWGAFALDEKTGIGTSKGMRSKGAAQRAAIKDCQRKGGTDCRIEFSYHNQCGVIVAADVGFSVASSETVDQAARNGMEACVRAGSKNCHLYFSDCSPAELVK
ncbi:DUF4189 domain-containing protein [Lysobacter capsici]|uniref:DUF4189 domain-containing protein n=2 Tax=Lysobacter TaxID=68 RepID=UPI003D2F989F